MKISRRELFGKVGLSLAACGFSLLAGRQLRSRPSKPVWYDIWKDWMAYVTRKGLHPHGPDQDIYMKIRKAFFESRGFLT